MQENSFIKNLHKTYVTLGLHFPYSWITKVTFLLCITFPFIDFIVRDC